MMSEVIEYKDGYNSENSICLIWCVDDIKYAMQERENPIEITDEECMDILTFMDYKHDASLGVCWDTIDYHLDDFIEKKEKESEEKK